MKLSWSGYVSFCSSEENFPITVNEGNNHLNFLFHDEGFCHARSSENMARQIYLHGRPLVRCTFFLDPFTPPPPPKKKKNARIVYLKNPDLDLIWRIHSKCGFSGFMIRFWIEVIIYKIRFPIQESGFGFLQKNAVNLWSFTKIHCKLSEIWEPKFANIYKEWKAQEIAILCDIVEKVHSRKLAHISTFAIQNDRQIIITAIQYTCKTFNSILKRKYYLW